MKNRMVSLFLTLALLLGILPAYTVPAGAAQSDLPTSVWVAATEANGLPIRIDAFQRRSYTQTREKQVEKPGTCGIGTTTETERYTVYLVDYEIYLPYSADVSQCFLSWDKNVSVTVGTQTYTSGTCPIPAAGQAQQTYVINETTEFKVTTYQGSPSVPAVFIDIDESGGNPSIADMDGDASHNVTCTGRVCIDGQWYGMPKMKGRGNATWEESLDKKPYNITLDTKINFPGVDSPKTKKWSLLAEVLDHSLLCNRAGLYLAHQLGIGQDTNSADVWMNGEYQGCYTVTPKTDSFVTKDGYMIEQDNYKEKAVSEGGDPQFSLDGLISNVSGWSSAYNFITVKDMGDNLLLNNGVVDESAENLQAAAERIRTWLQDAWDAIRSDDGKNADGKHFTEYIDLESFARMYLMHEYVKSYDVCAGSILFHRDGQGDADKLIAGPLWDLDNAMGSIYQNSRLGQADDRTHGDRRRGDGDFIPLVTEYKTSIYKTLSKHEIFMKAVSNQYNKYWREFNALPEEIEQMKADISASAMMNHAKVQDKGHGTGDNNHYYGSKTTLGSGQYAQTYLATTDSKTDWPNYVANLKTYAAARSLWFYNKFYDPNDPANCEHEYQDTITPPTCTTEGYTTHYCPKCKDEYRDEFTPIIPHDYQNGECTVCHQALLNVTVSRTPGVSFTVYETQDLEGPSETNAELVHPRSADTGMIDCSGDGQVNFTVELTPGYELVSVTAEPASAYKNFKLPADTGVENCYRVTKVKDDFTITVTARCTHDYSETVTAPTCTEGGFTTHTCAICGDVYVTDELPALGHDLIDNPAQAPTCTGIGWAAYQTCSRCDYTTYVEIAATGHTPGEAEEENRVEANCTEDGSYDEVVYCAACGEELSREAKVIEAMNHDLIHHEAQAATCTEIGWNAYDTCSRCDYTTYEEIPAKGHTPGEAEKENRVEATCTDAGSYDEVVYCAACGDELSREAKVIEALSHYLIQHEGKTPTCTEIGWKGYETCSRCDYTTYVVIDAVGHIPNEAVEENRAEATCTVPGSYDEVIYCDVCDAELSRETKAIEALGHDLVNHDAKAPTCTEHGWAAYDTCSRCDYTTYEEIPATGHTPDVPVHENVVDATCIESGSYDEVVYCAACGEELSREPMTLEALGHSYEAVVTAPTCTESGYTTYTCTHCGDVCTADETDPLGHDLIDHPAQAPTYTAIGWEAYQTCSRCDYSTYRELPALVHTPGEPVEENRTEPTCTVPGSYDEVVYCTDCGEELSREPKEIPALGHVCETVVTAPTCTEGGYTTYTCTVCGEVYTADETEPLGHAYETVVTAPTCTEGGYTTYTCTVCGEVYTADETEPLGHAYETVVTAPTCTTGGYTTYTCSRCNDVYVGDEIEALGHAWDDGTVTLEPTETEPGVMTFTCTRCGGTRTEVIPIPLQSYTVIFDANHGTGRMERQEIARNEYAYLTKNAFTRPGYTFAGWNTAPDGSGTAISNGARVRNLTAEPEITLYAKWKPNTYNIKFYGNGGSGSMSIQTVTYGVPTPLKANVYTRAGYTFSGWNTKTDGSGRAVADGEAVTDLITSGMAYLYAQWTPNRYEIVFQPNGGEGVMEPQSIPYGQYVDLTPNAYTRTGYTFIGWNTRADGSGTAYTNGHRLRNLVYSGTVTLYARWRVNTYTIAFDPNGGSGTMADKTVTYNESAVLPENAFTRDGSAFMGWNTAADGSGTAYADKETVRNLAGSGTIVLYAQWTSGGYRIVFEPNGGTGTMEDQAIPYGASAPLTANAFTRDGCSFAGWNTAADGSGTAYADGAIVQNLTAGGTAHLYAQWTQSSYQIVFEPNGGSGTMENQAIPYGASVALTKNAFTRRGYSFKGWNTRPDGTGTAYANGSTVRNLTTGGTAYLYAQWKPNSYNIKFYGNGGSGSMTHQYLTYGVATPLKANAYTRAGYTFVGWNTKPNGTGTAYADGEAVTDLASSGTAYLYAQWKKN